MWLLDRLMRPNRQNRALREAARLEKMLLSGNRQDADILRLLISNCKREAEEWEQKASRK